MNASESNPIPPALDAYGRREQARTLVAPPGFAEKVELRLASETARRRRVTRMAGWVLAASVVIAVGILGLPKPRKDVPRPQPGNVEIASVKLGEEWSEAGRSLENLTNQATEPAKRLLEGSANLQLPEATTVEPRLPQIEFANVAAAGLEPIASTPRRAVNTMLRDLGIDPLGN